MANGWNVFSMRVDEDTMERLRKLSAVQGKSLSATAREALRLGLEPQIFGEQLARVEELLREAVTQSVERQTSYIWNVMRGLDAEIVGVRAAVLMAHAQYLGSEDWDKDYVNEAMEHVIKFSEQKAKKSLVSKGVKSDRIKIISFDKEYFVPGDEIQF